jgi:hemoglobin
MGSSLYERLGGKDGISAVVQSFSGRVGGDARINQKFARTNVPRLRALLAEQICEATGGPFVYTGRGMKESHAGMAVTEGEFDAMVDDLRAALDEHKVAKDDQRKVLAFFASLRDQVVEVDSAETGTPLPDTFQPAT